MTVELTAPLVSKNDEKRLAFGPVLVPDEADSDGDVVNADKIEQVAHKFAEDYGNIDLMHTLNNVGKMVETYIQPVEMTYKQQDGSEVVVPQGSWMLGVRVTDDAAWKSVQSGELGGFSMMGIPKSAQKSADKGQAAEKRTTLKDLGDEWIVNAVSLVDRPAVPKGKFVAIKSAPPEPSNTNAEGILKRIKNMMAGKSQDDDKGGESKVDDQTQGQQTTVDESKLKEMIQQAVSEAKEEDKQQQQKQQEEQETEKRLQEIEQSVKSMKDEQQKHTFTRPVSGLFKSVAGQDGEGQANDVIKSDRDPFGFKVKKGDDE